MISAILRSGKVFKAWGVWRVDTIRSWQGAAISSGRILRFPDNARVRGDGTVGFHG